LGAAQRLHTQMLELAKQEGLSKTLRENLQAAAVY